MSSRAPSARPSLEIGETIELEVTGIAHGGVSVARHDGRVVFVADAVPGESVRARVTDAKKKSFARATTVEVLEASRDRRPHVWAEADLARDPEDRAGGAEFGHIALERQRTLKAEVLADAMRRFGGVRLAAEEGEDLADALSELVEPAPGDAAGGLAGVHHASAPGLADTHHASAPGLGYRTRVRLHVDPRTGAVGPYAARSRRVITVDSLPLATPGINQIAPLHDLMPGVDAVDLVAPAADDPRMLLTLSGEKGRAGEHDAIRELVEDRGFVVRAGGFWQVHREAPAVLFTAVRDAISDLADDGRFDPAAANLDLYGGAGLLAAAMAEAAGPGLRVTTVETDAGATDDAAENLSELVGALALTARVDRHLAELLRAAAPVRERLRRGTVLLDPPRSGAGGAVMGQIAELSPAGVVYVACDPVALARDTGTLRDAGYELTSLRAFDIFPHTHHFETLAVFQRT
ncbi:class I SAM-dependent RNA methyltransferase [Leucobacter sp. wl10]|uniref:class I SAM-dependent RNA methyltransferase n=1 Tax=Leucobacter sp. wl10 TaxID=2304677 RepID=UPI00267DB027